MLSGKHALTGGISASLEHYLRAIWEVRTQRGYARLADVARELKVAPPTLSVGIRSLVSRGLVTHDDHRFLLLTAEGERLAREVHHRFAVMHAFLRDVLGVPEAEATADACLIEHGVSATTTERVLHLLKLLHSDRSLNEMIQQRMAGYHPDCRPVDGCRTCDLSCMVGVAPPA